MSGAAALHALLRCDGAAVPTDLARRTWDVEAQVATSGARPDLNLHADGLAGKVLGRLDARAADLVRIAAYAYAADRMVPRGRSAAPVPPWSPASSLGARRGCWSWIRGTAT